MTKYIIVAITHDLRPNEASDQLMGPASIAKFKEKVLPHLTDNSLVLLEGFEHKKLIGPEHPTYSILTNITGGAFGEVRPILGGCDFRQTQERRGLEERMYLWEKICDKYVRVKIQTMPQTLEEALEAAHQKLPHAYLSEKPTRDVVEIARWTGAIDRKFDRLYLEAMANHGRKFDTCIFVGGAIHAIAMALKSNYQLVDATGGNQDDIASIYLGHLANYHWTRLFLGAKP